MKDANLGSVAIPSGENLRIGIVQSRFNWDITSTMAKSAIAELNALGVPANQITHLEVPGALEVPVALQTLAKSKRFDALIALGCIIRGETYHFELVANESAAGITRLTLDHQLPIANAILTTENEAQAIDRQVSKAQDAARVAVEMADLLKNNQ